MSIIFNIRYKLFITNQIINKIESSIIKKFKTIKKIINIFSKLLFDYKIGNVRDGLIFKDSNYYDVLNAGPNGPGDKSKQLFVFSSI